MSFILLAAVFAVAQDQPQTEHAEHMEQTPTFRVTVVTRSTSAVNYRHHSGQTELDFHGTEMMAEAKGKVVSNQNEKGTGG